MPHNFIFKVGFVKVLSTRRVHWSKMKINNQKILVFGGTGSLGQALVRRLSEVNNLILFSRDEAKHWTIKNNLKINQNVYVVHIFYYIHEHFQKNIEFV